MMKISKFLVTFAILTIVAVGQAKAQTPEIGYILCKDGSFVNPDDWQTTNDKTPIGVVFWLDPNTPDKGIAVALNDAGETKWSTNTTDISDLPNLTNQKQAFADYNGKTNTATLRALQPATDYPAVHAITQAGYSTDFYLPSIGELRRLHEQRSIVNKTFKILNEKQAGTATRMFKDYYWSSSEYFGSSAWRVSCDGLIYDLYPKSFSFGVRPVVAFE